MKHTAAFLLAACAGALGFWPVSAIAQQQAPNVMIDGSAMAFSDQPPVERAGRIYVPMRALFERLGATVVYENGTINATRGHRTIQLQIGSQTATVDGQQVQLDSPAFEIGDRTLVPLRFIAQALGAQVAWNESQMTAYIHTQGMGSGGYSYQPPAAPAGPTYGDRMVFTDRSPSGNVAQRYPTIAATFRVPLRPDSVVVRVDGRDVTGAARVTPHGFELSSSSRLWTGSHRVSVSGTTMDGRAVYDSWSFTVVPQ